jgi:DNA replication protein DnaC
MTASALIEQIKDDLGYLRLHRSAEVFALLAEGARRDESSHLEFLAALVAKEVAATRQRRLTARLRFAHFPARRTLEEFDFSFQPSIDPKVIADLAGLGFVEAGTPILLLGKHGRG